MQNRHGRIMQHLKLRRHNPVQQVSVFLIEAFCLLSGKGGADPPACLILPFQLSLVKGTDTSNIVCSPMVKYSS